MLLFVSCQSGCCLCIANEVFYVATWMVKQQVDNEKVQGTP